jgi:hypothetical protein
MTSPLKPVLALIIAAALTPGASACGQVVVPTGASSTPTTSTSPSTPAATPSVTASAPTLDGMYAKAVAAVKKAKSVQMKITFRDSPDGDFTAEIRGTLDGTNVQRTMHEADGGISTTLVVHGKTYVKGNKAFWRSRISGVDPAKLAGRWVTFAGKLPDGYSFPTLRVLLEQDLSDWAPGELRHEVADVDSQSTNGRDTYRAYSGSDSNAFVVDARTALPVRFTALSEYGQMTATLAGWNTVPKFTAPSAYVVVTLK